MSERVCVSPVCSNPIIRRFREVGTRESTTSFKKRKYCGIACRKVHTSMKALAKAKDTPPEVGNCQVCTAEFTRKRKPNGMWAETLFVFRKRVTCKKKTCVDTARNKRLFAPKRKPETFNDVWAKRSFNVMRAQAFISQGFRHKVQGANTMGVGR